MMKAENMKVAVAVYKLLSDLNANQAAAVLAGVIMSIDSQRPGFDQDVIEAMDHIRENRDALQTGHA